MSDLLNRVDQFLGKSPQQEPQAPVDLMGRVDQFLGKAPTTNVEETPTETPWMTPSGLVDLPSVLKEYNRELVKDDILNDERLMEVIYQDLETKFQPGLSREAYRAAAGLAGAEIGGLAGRDYRGMGPEKAFEIWQNRQRSFAGGQSVTTADELVKVTQGDETEKARIGAGYVLFDAMDNAFVGEGTWGETFDAAIDYTKAAIWDPMTILTLGVGKALSTGSTKIGTAAARKVMISSYKSLLKKGVSKEAAKRVVGGAAKTAAYTTPEIMFNVGSDVGYQLARLEAGAQEEYSGLQTGISAMGAAVIPALLTGSSAVKALRQKTHGRLAFLNHSKIDKAIIDQGEEKAWDIVRYRLNKTKVSANLDNQIKAMRTKPDEFTAWGKLKEEAKAGIKARSESKTDSELLNEFETFFWFGNKELGVKGYAESLLENGFAFHKALLKGGDQTKSGVYAETIKWLDDEVVSDFIKTFEDATGRKLGLDYTAEGLSQHFANNSTEAGKTLAIRSMLPTIEKEGLDAPAAMKAIAGKATKEATEEHPKRFQFALSIYKRAITSHLATTGANLKGFAFLTSMNSMADYATAAINLSQGVFYSTLAKNPEKATVYFNRSLGSVLGPIRRTMNFLDPEMPMEYARKVLELNPEIEAKMFRDIAGDGGVRDSLKMFNLDDTKNPIYKGIDSATKGAQTLTLVRAQDDITKTLSFAGHLDQAIMREYGVSDPMEILGREDFLAEMATKRFQENVLEKALYRTMRETASVNWSTLKRERNFARSAAVFVETLTNKTPLGFVVPFGSFMNTTFATLGDMTGVNAVRALYRKVTGQKLDFVTAEGADLLGKAVAGYTLLGISTYAAKDRIKAGLAWNQQMNEDGSTEDRSFDWPASTFRLMGQMLAHATPDDWNGDPSQIDITAIPDGLYAEFVNQSGGQALRDIDDTIQQIENAFRDVKTSGSTLELFGAVMGPITARIFQGVSRPLDPVNTVVGLVKGDNMDPDLRQGAKNYNDAIKYINHILPEGISGVQSLPVRARPTSGTNIDVDIGRQMVGVRHAKNPTLAEAMLNSAGRPAWNEIRWDGPAVVRNHMDALAAPIYNQEALKALKQNPNYFFLPQDKKSAIMDSVKESVRSRVMQVMTNSPIPAELDAVRLLSGKDKKKVAKVMDFMNIEGDLEDILEQPDAIDILNKIKVFVDNYDEIFHGELSLD